MEWLQAPYAEGEGLAKRTKQLRREHADLQCRPDDVEAHDLHRSKLRAHMDALQAHHDTLRHLRRAPRNQDL
jgi:hypothetical protein